jgi:signal transduction histidine kinase
MKRLRLRKRTLSLRLWLILAVVAITGAGFLAQIGMAAPVSALEQQAEDARLADARQIIGADAAQWRDPAWRHRADASFAGLNLEAALFPTQLEPAAPPGQAIYATSGAHRFLDTGVQDTAGAAVKQAPAQTQPDDAAQFTFHRLVIANPARSASQLPVGVAFLWDTSPTQPAHGVLLGFLWAVVELSMFALTLAIVLWLIGQPVLRPLAAMNQAAEGIAGGDLNVSLPRTPVREIAEVSAALEGMSGALRQSLDRQTALEEERRLFVGAIAHDLRTPLFILRGHLKGLERGVAATPEKIAHYVAVSQAEADALERLIADLFAYTRLEYLEQTPERAPLELRVLLYQAVEGAQRQAAAKAITVTLDAQADGSCLLGDRHLLARAVENLLDNALRHTPQGGRITVGLTRQNALLVFTVADTGPGIAADDLPRLFTPLYRGEASRNRQTGGAGLGLAISRRILRAHGGDLTAANRAEGGAIFRGTLPVLRRVITAASSAAEVGTA